MPTNIETLVLSVLEETLDLSEHPQIKIARRYLRAFLAQETAQHFREAAIENARISMLSLATLHLVQHWIGPTAVSRIAELLDYIQTHRSNKE